MKHVERRRWPRLVRLVDPQGNEESLQTTVHSTVPSFSSQRCCWQLPELLGLPSSHFDREAYVRKVKGKDWVPLTVSFSAERDRDND